MSEERKLKCPSYVCKPGAELYGMVNSRGKVNFLKQGFEVDLSFVKEATKYKDPESRFRFAGNCAKSGCKQWKPDTKECGLIDKVIALVAKPESKDLQPCPIRTKCRWYSQKKNLACSQCDEVFRNLEGSIVEAGNSNQF